MAEAASHAPVAHEVHEHHEPQTFFRKYIWSLDHKVIGIQYMIASLVMLYLGGLLAMMIRTQLGFPGESALGSFWGWLFPGGVANGAIKQDFYLALVTMHGTIMIFFVLTTILTGGFGNFLIPLQIGARDMAYPFLNAVSFWLYPPAIVILLAAFFVAGGAPNSGWTAYPPLSAIANAAPGSQMGQTLWLISLALMILAFTFGSLNYITTIINLRTRGMSMLRLPLSVWGLFVTAILSLLAFPVLFAASVMLLFDRVAGTSFFVPAGLVVGGNLITHTGGDPLLWQHMFWFLGHPEVYVLILPAMGMVSEILANHARKPIFGYRAMVLSIAAIALLSFLVWGHHMFVSGMHPLLGTAFMTTTLFIAVPSAVKTFNWLATLWGGKLRFTTAMLFAVGFVSWFVTGGLTGVILAQPALDVHVHDTYFVVAHFHFVMASASLFAVYAGLYHWFPKMFGRHLSERLGKWHFWLAYIGTFGTFFPMHFLGLMGMTRRYYAWDLFPNLAGIQPVNTGISLFAFMTGIAHALFIVNVVWTFWKGKRSEERNPWQGTTLEWSAPSPPPHGNWGTETPVVRRWAYEYSAPGAVEDYIPQDAPEAIEVAGDGQRGNGQRAD